MDWSSVPSWRNSGLYHLTYLCVVSALYLVSSQEWGKKEEEKKRAYLCVAAVPPSREEKTKLATIAYL